MTNDRSGWSRARYWVLALAAAAGFFVLAVNDAVYDATSPEGMPHHVIVRKLYSLGCFAVLGFLWRRSFPASGWARSIAGAATAIAAYSVLVELGQRVAGSHESIKWNIVDVVLGGVGGATGGAIDSVLSFLSPKGSLRPTRRAKAPMP